MAMTGHNYYQGPSDQRRRHHSQGAPVAPPRSSQTSNYPQSSSQYMQYESQYPPTLNQQGRRRQR